jgi:hypothetical protein
MANLVYLCSFHHHLVHEGGWALTMSDAGAVTVEDPGGAEFHEVPPLVAPAGAVACAQDMPSGGEAFRMSDVIDSLVDLERPLGVA